MASYLSLMLGAPIPPFDIGKIALSHAICPFGVYLTSIPLAYSSGVI